MSHPILAEHPAYVAHRQKITDLEEARLKWQERTRKIGDQYQARADQHQKAAREALLRGDEPPSEPAPPSEGNPDEARLFVTEASRLRDEERELLADLAEEVEEAAAAREEELMAEARPLVENLEKITAEAAELVSTVRQVRQARERRREAVAPGGGVSDRMRQQVTRTDLIAAVIDRVRLLDPVKPPPRQIVAAGFEPDKPVKEATAVNLRNRI